MSEHVLPENFSVDITAAPVFTPDDWYWRRDDGGLFSSARIAIISDSDEAYLEWCAMGKIATPWPVDDAGEQTVAELQHVLNPYNLFASLAAYAAGLRYELEIAGVLVTVGGEVALVSTARENRDGMRDTMLAILTKLRSDGATIKIFADGIARPATNAEASAMIAEAFAWVQGAFDKELAVVTDIEAGKVSSKLGVEEAFAPVGAPAIGPTVQPAAPTTPANPAPASAKPA